MKSIFILVLLPAFFNIIQTKTLETTFTGTTRNHGIVFSVRALSEDIRLTGLSINCDTGDHTIKLYRKIAVGEYTTFNTATEWRLEAVRDISCTLNAKTDFGGINIYITNGNTQSFILFNSETTAQVISYSVVTEKTTTIGDDISIISGTGLTGSNAFSWTSNSFRNPNILVRYQKVNCM